jgi:hypothetical protein
MLLDMDDDETYVILVRGHSVITHDDGHSWHWEDTGDLVVDEAIAEDVDPETFERPCVRCEQYATPDGHDACIAGLPGVSNACCGHGIDPPYIQFDDEGVFREVVKFMRTLNKTEVAPNK